MGEEPGEELERVHGLGASRGPVGLVGAIGELLGRGIVGEAAHVDLARRVGSKPGKQRPCLAIQPPEVAQAGLTSTVILPLTTRLLAEPAFPLRVRMPAGTCRLMHASDIMVDQIMAWDNAAFHDDLGAIPEPLQDLVRAALTEFLDLAA